MKSLVENCKVNKIIKDNECILEFSNDTGKATMNFIEVFKGIQIIYNYFDMLSIKSSFKSKQNLFCIDYCIEGRLEQELKNRTYSYVKTNDIKLDCLGDHDGEFYFPLSHYKAITIGFDIETAQVTLDNLFGKDEINLSLLKDKFCKDDYIYFIRNHPKLIAIFKELEHVDEEIKIPLFKIKIFEILLILKTLETNKLTKVPLYFYKGQVEKVKALHEYLCLNIENHDTLNDLATKFDLSLTTMKTCFKEIYGQAIHGYLRSLRIKKASTLLVETENDIVDIALEVGYDNASKFAAAFKKEIGILPSEYRKQYSRRKKNG